MTGHAFEAEDIASSSRLGGNSRAIHALPNKSGCVSFVFLFY